ncbi:hypothetical protein LCGC14_1400500 [marine sediment metagenome]|uniref:Uncharacterized protein n=1 Tax=marine sediment metagenome TaxID=412755 RepID=A0A0F9JX85_9ZZZZ
MPYQGIKPVQSVTLVGTGTVGADGSASERITTDVNHPISGMIVGVHITYDASAPATTDFILGDGTGADSQNILTIANGTDDGWFYPSANVHASDATQFPSEFQAFYFNGPLVATILQVDSDQVNTVKVLYV